VRSYLLSLTEKVELIPKTDATLSGRSATVPVTVQNNLVQGVDHLVLKLTSDNPQRLKLGDPQPIKVNGGHSQSVKFPATAKANGRAFVTAQLYTENGARYGEPITFQLTVTEVTPTVMLVIAGGVLLLVLAGVRMYARRKRAAAGRAGDGEQPEQGPTTEGAESAAPEETLPEQQGDPTPDTAPDNGDPSSTGEKVDR
jgi:hypothetical protein